MARTTRSVARRARHKKVVKMAKGYRGRTHSSYRLALQQVQRALQYAYRDRRTRKRDFRRLWIQRINAGARQYGLTYGKFVHGMKRAGIEIDRKMLADIAVRDPAVFKAIVERAQAALAEA